MPNSLGQCVRVVVTKQTKICVTGERENTVMRKNRILSIVSVGSILISLFLTGCNSRIKTYTVRELETQWNFHSVMQNDVVVYTAKSDTDPTMLMCVPSGGGVKIGNTVYGVTEFTCRLCDVIKEDPKSNTVKNDLQILVETRHKWKDNVSVGMNITFKGN